MRAIGSVTQITELIPGGQAAIERIAGAQDYEPVRDTVTEAIQVLSLQSAILLGVTLLSLLFYKRNR